MQQYKKSDSTVIQSVTGDQTEHPTSEHISTETEEEIKSTNDGQEAQIYQEPEVADEAVVERKQTPIERGLNRTVMTPLETSVVNWHATKPSAVNLMSSGIDSNDNQQREKSNNDEDLFTKSINNKIQSARLPNELVPSSADKNVMPFVDLDP